MEANPTPTPMEPEGPFKSRSISPETKDQRTTKVDEPDQAITFEELLGVVEQKSQKPPEENFDDELDDIMLAMKSQTRVKPNEQGSYYDSKDSKPPYAAKAKQPSQNLRPADAPPLEIKLGSGKIEGRDEITISTWNINGLRAIAARGDLDKYFKQHPVDMICFNETKIDLATFREQRCDQLLPPGYTSYWNFCKTKKGYSGVGIATKHLPLAVTYDIGVEDLDQEGRVITAEFEDFYLVAVYVPNSGDKCVRIDYRTKQWDPAFLEYLNKLNKLKPVILAGDLNVARFDIDVHDPQSFCKYPGFRPEERRELEKYFECGWVDLFRHFHPDEPKRYSWYGFFQNKDKRTVGMRLDYFLADDRILQRTVDCQIYEGIYGSDHVPVHLRLRTKKPEPTIKTEST